MIVKFYSTIDTIVASLTCEEIQQRIAVTDTSQSTLMEVPLASGNARKNLACKWLESSERNRD
ncbi:hypothetical protein K0M31_015906 [Melipona bicolor]|uniref:Uncharacterized protein n=1 Tax=Melipona bicolor TaxID=60889 RepID=A0AA40G5Z0_9HYME|nr:hypothetical protein K0M31_015906 [Melipona bicolor]